MYAGDLFLHHPEADQAATGDRAKRHHRNHIDAFPIQVLFASDRFISARARRSTNRCRGLVKESGIGLIGH